MTINDKVLYSGDVYKIIFDYKNGHFEIMRDDLLRKVELVKENEIQRL
ncbi:hypothetical protein [Bacillus sp. T3]|nr:hypothetical protein [Bacillus sp. T3]